MSNQTPLQKYEAALATGNFSRDDVQANAVAYLDKLYHDIVKNESEQNQGFFASLFKGKPTTPKGLYMWGGVGRGKTWLMDMFYDSLPIEKKCVCTFIILCKEYKKNWLLCVDKLIP